MFTTRISKLVVVLFVLAAALATVSFTTRSTKTSAVDRSYDAIEKLRSDTVQVDDSYNLVEQVRANRPNLLSLAGYDQIEAVRVQRGIALMATSFDAVEQLRLERAFSADYAYDQIENLRLSR